MATLPVMKLERSDETRYRLYDITYPDQAVQWT